MLNAKDLTYQANGKFLVTSANLSVPAGQVIAVLGPNGAGKSTLLKMLSGQLRPREGTITFDGRPLERWPLRELARRRAVLPQNSPVPFDFTALEIVLLGRSPHGDGARFKNGALRAMHKTESAHLAQRSVTTLSGGEVQRVQLARVLVQIDHYRPGNPRCLILDEPVSNLDPAHQHFAMRVARELAADGTAVLVVLHDLNLAAQYADRIILMKNARIAAEGKPHEVLTELRIAEIFDVEARVTTNPFCGAPAVFVKPRQ